MKKFLVLLLVFTLFVFASCNFTFGGGGKVSSGSSDDGDVMVPTVTVDDAIESLNAAFESGFSRVNLSVTTTTDALSVKDTFTFTFGTDSITVTYSVTSANQIIVDGDTVTIPDEKYTTKSGTVEIVDGVATTTDGDETDIDFTSVTQPLISIDKQNLTDVSVTDTQLTATITDLSEVIADEDLTGVSASLTTTWSPTLKNIKISYTMESGAEVKLEYTFTA